MRFGRLILFGVLRPYRDADSCDGCGAKHYASLLFWGNCILQVERRQIEFEAAQKSKPKKIVFFCACQADFGVWNTVDING
jgi:hypothetical protein